TPDGLRELVRRCRAVSTRPIAVKLSPVLSDIAGMARVAEREGADAVTLVNTIPGTLEGRLGNGAGGVSGPALLAIGVLATRKVRTAVAIPVIGVGGIRTARDAREDPAAGASLVAIGPAVLAAAGQAAGEMALVGVTVLTSHEAGDFERVVGRGVPDLGFEAERLGRLAVAAGLRGVVASGHELALLRGTLGPEPWIVVRG